MGVQKLHTAVCKCDGCGVATTVPVDADSTLIECLLPGWYMLDIKIQKRTDCGYNSAPAECLTVCSLPCVSAALKARLK